MNVIISPNIKKQSDRIDPDGNIINPATKQIIQKNEVEFVPQETKPQEVNEVKTNSMSEKINAMVEAKIKEKIDAIVAQRVDEALKNL